MALAQSRMGNKTWVSKVIQTAHKTMKYSTDWRGRAVRCFTEHRYYSFRKRSHPSDWTLLKPTGAHSSTQFHTRSSPVQPQVYLCLSVPWFSSLLNTSLLQALFHRGTCFMKTEFSSCCCQGSQGRARPCIALPYVLPLRVRALPKADGAEDTCVLVEERAGRQPHPVPCVNAVVSI